MRVSLNLMTGALLVILGLLIGRWVCPDVVEPNREATLPLLPPVAAEVAPDAQAEQIHIPGGAYVIEGDPTPGELQEINGEVLP